MFRGLRGWARVPWHILFLLLTWWSCPCSSHCQGSTTGSVLWLSSGLSYWHWGVPDCRGSQPCAPPRNTGCDTRAEFTPSPAASGLLVSSLRYPLSIHTSFLSPRPPQRRSLRKSLAIHQPGYIFPRISLLSVQRCPPHTHFQYPRLPYQGQVKIHPSLRSLGLLSDGLGAKSRSALGRAPLGSSLWFKLCAGSTSAGQ